MVSKKAYYQSRWQEESRREHNDSGLKARTIEVSGRLERSNCKIPISERNCKFRIARQGIQGTDQQNHRAQGKNETPKLKNHETPSF
jgi:hypothetical protein